MKTVVDAVNEFRGVWLGGSDTSTLWLLDGGVPMQYGDTITERTVCTRDEFEQCVAEMTEGLFVPLSDLNKRKAVETLTDKDGNQYQKGAIYEFSDREDFKSSTADRLVRIVNEKDEVYIFGTLADKFRHCRETSAVLGTITKAPLALEDGAAYSFRAGELATTGLYVKEKDMMLFINGVAKLSACTNITKLVPEAK